MNKGKWEMVTAEHSEQTDRLVVDGGWIYRTRTPNGATMCFVPGVHGFAAVVKEEAAGVRRAIREAAQLVSASVGPQ